MMRIIYLFLFFIATAIASEESTFNGWTHLELGAGNYGPDGHTKASQEMTVLLKIEDVTDEKNYIDGLEEQGRGDYKPEDQYGVLFWTLDELVKRYGDVGIFHVNDLYDEYAIFAAQKLKDYAASRGYDSIIVDSVPGDYQWINASQTLSPYGKDKYSTAHLKNPEVSFYHDRMDGDFLYSSFKSREQTRLMLQDLANLSESGLFLFILNLDDFIPREEKAEFMEKNLFYHASTEWEPVPYIFPEGGAFDKEIGRVFLIDPT